MFLFSEGVEECKRLRFYESNWRDMESPKRKISQTLVG